MDRLKKHHADCRDRQSVDRFFSVSRKHGVFFGSDTRICSILKAWLASVRQNASKSANIGQFATARRLRRGFAGLQRGCRAQRALIQNFIFSRRLGKALRAWKRSHFISKPHKPEPKESILRRFYTQWRGAFKAVYDKKRMLESVYQNYLHQYGMDWRQKTNPVSSAFLRWKNSSTRQRGKSVSFFEILHLPTRSQPNCVVRTVFSKWHSVSEYRSLSLNARARVFRQRQLKSRALVLFKEWMPRESVRSRTLRAAEVYRKLSLKQSVFNGWLYLAQTVHPPTR